MIHEVVIIGGGFGGVRVAKILAQEKDIHITLLDKSRYHTFHPNLYEVATAYLPEVFGHVPYEFINLKSSGIYPLEEIFLDDLNVTVLENEVTNIDFKKHQVVLRGVKKHRYDILVVAAGSETNYFGISGLEERALTLKNFFEALSVRNALDEAFVRFPKNHIIKIVIGGGGFTGCELAGEMAGYLKKLAQVHGHPEYYVECLIVEAGPTFLGSASPWVQKKAKERLASLGVKFKLGSAVKAVSDGELVLQDGSKVQFDVLIWTAGVKANNLVHILSGVKLEKAFCMMVDEYLRILPYENVFGAGDMTYCVDELTGRALPMTASVALREAKYVAENVKRSLLKKSLKKYKPHHAGFIIPLGGKYALLETHGIRLAGFVPWVLKHLVSLHYWSTVLGWWRAFQLWRQGLKIFVRND